MSANKTNSSSIIKLISQTGLWTEAVGFLYLGIAAILAHTLTGSSGAHEFTAIPFVSVAVAFVIIIQSVIGTLFVLGGYYLRKVQSSQTKLVLTIVAVLSALAILSIVSLISAILSIYTLVRLKRVKLSLPKKRPRKPFDLRDYPALSILSVILVFNVVCLCIGTTHTAKSLKTTDVFGLPKTVKATCRTVTASSCTLADTAYGFSITMPGQPTTQTFSASKDEGDSDHIAATAGGVEYRYSVSNDKEGAAYRQTIYEVKSNHYLHTFDGQDPRNIPADEQSRLVGDGLSPVLDLCDTPHGIGLYEAYSTVTTYQAYPAINILMTNGKAIFNQNCSFESTSFLKGNYLYSIGYMSVPATADSTNFNKLLQTFSLTN